MKVGGDDAKHRINYVLQDQLNASCMKTLQNAVPVTKADSLQLILRCDRAAS